MKIDRNADYLASNGKQRFFGPNCFPVSTVDPKNLTSKGDILEIMLTLFQRAWYSSCSCTEKIINTVNLTLNCLDWTFGTTDTNKKTNRTL